MKHRDPIFALLDELIGAGWGSTPRTEIPEDWRQRIAVKMDDDSLTDLDTLEAERANPATQPACRVCCGTGCLWCPTEKLKRRSVPHRRLFNRPLILLHAERMKEQQKEQSRKQHVSAGYASARKRWGYAI